MIDGELSNIDVHLKHSEYLRDILILLQNVDVACRKVNTVSIKLIRNQCSDFNNGNSNSKVTSIVSKKVQLLHFK
jgi:hypothetical protein